MIVPRQTPLVEKQPLQIVVPSKEEAEEKHSKKKEQAMVKALDQFIIKDEEA